MQQAEVDGRSQDHAVGDHGAGDRDGAAPLSLPWLTPAESNEVGDGDGTDLLPVEAVFKPALTDETPPKLTIGVLVEVVASPLAAMEALWWRHPSRWR